MFERRFMPENIEDVSSQKITRNDKLVCPPLYCDTTNVQTSKFGVSIRFGHAVVSSEEELVADDYVVVGMTAEHAAALHQVLGSHLRRLARKHGPLRGYPEYSEDSE
jgi:hypothetical protein